MLYRLDLTEVLDDAGEHSASSSRSVLRGDAMRNLATRYPPWLLRPDGRFATAGTACLGRTACVLPPIRTLTVGPGIPPGQPAAGSGRVADFDRRFGVSPTPEHALLV